MKAENVATKAVEALDEAPTIGMFEDNRLSTLEDELNMLMNNSLELNLLIDKKINALFGPRIQDKPETQSVDFSSPWMERVSTITSNISDITQLNLTRIREL